MASKTILITGATDGIGRDTALELARQGHHILLHGRSREKVEAVRAQIEKAGGSVGGVLLADFASLEEVRRMADETLKRYERLEVLVNNAGIMLRQRRTSAEGYELIFAVNHLAPFVLTLRLLPLLERSAPARIVNVSSTTHHSARRSYLDDVQAERKFDGYTAYAFSKLANILFTNALARRLEGRGVTVNALHPGVVNTKLLRAGYGAQGLSPEEGAATPVYLAISSEVEGVTGKYFMRRQEAETSPLAQDVEFQEQVWQLSEDWTGQTGPVSGGTGL